MIPEGITRLRQRISARNNKPPEREVVSDGCGGCSKGMVPLADAFFDRFWQTEQPQQKEE